MAHSKKSKDRFSELSPDIQKILIFIEERVNAVVEVGPVISTSESLKRIVLKNENQKVSILIQTEDKNHFFYVNKVSLQNLYNSLYPKFHPEFEITLR